ncbi:MAG: tyrosine-type recombinase/integrase [Granulosicoccus sp.]
MIRATKFRKNRLVPIHASIRRALEKYLSNGPRDKINNEAPVFISTMGTRLSYSTAFQGFLTISRSVGLRAAPGTSGPNLHDFRHSYAVRSLESCPACAQSVQQHMVALSTYLGHTHISDTYWYLEATTKLAAHIAQLTEADFVEGQS